MSIGRTSPLTSRKVYQELKDVALGTRTMTRERGQSWNVIYHGIMPLGIVGWHLTIFLNGVETRLGN